MRIKLGSMILWVLLVSNVPSQETVREKRNEPVASVPQSETTSKPATEEPSEDFWMRQKLEYSKAILESLTAGEFGNLAEAADKMRRLSKIEGFVRRRNQPYRQQLEAFNLANEALVRWAKEENTSESLSAFQRLTSSCVACHQLLREGAK